MYEKFKRLGKDSLIYGLGNMASRFIGLLLLPIYTRVFSPADYGIMDVIATMTTLASIVLAAGSGSALNFYFFKYSDPIERRKTLSTTSVYLLGINVLVAVGVWFMAEHISLLAFGRSVYAKYLRVAILSVPFASFIGLSLNIIRLQRRPWAYISFTISQLLLTTLLNIYLVVYLRVGIIGVFWTNLIVASFFSIVSIVMNRSFLKITALSYSRMVEILRYGLPLVIGGLSMWSINSVDRFFLVTYSTLDQVGLYSVGLRLASAVGFITWAFRLANAPFQFEMSSSEDAPTIYSLTLTYFVLIVSFLCVPLALFAKPVLRLLTTATYQEAYVVVGLAAYSAAAYGMYQIIGVGLLVMKKTFLSGVAIGIGAIANVIFLYFLVPPFGMVGAALAVLLTHLTVLILLFVLAQRTYPVPYNLKRVFSTLLCAGIVIGVGMIFSTKNIVIEILSASGLFISYIILLSVFSVITMNEKRRLVDAFKRVALVFRSKH